jgi:hypothetical protein
VAYEADALDLVERLGWSLVVVGLACLVPVEPVTEIARAAV